MKRHYYISDDLDSLETIGQELLDANITKPQFHVLSNDDCGVQQRNLHEVESVLKKDVVHSTELGAVIGVAMAVIVLFTANLLGMTNTEAGWVPFIFLAVVVLGFCTWEGGLVGIQLPNYQFERFQNILDKGKHVFFVDVERHQESVLGKVINRHPQLQMAGLGEPTPKWVIKTQDNYATFVRFMP